MDAAGHDGAGSGTAAGRPRLLVLASTFPRTPGDGTPAFVADLAREEARAFDVLVVVPHLQGAARRESRDGYRIVRFPYLPERLETVAEGAILENVRGHPGGLAQVPALLAAELAATRRAVRAFRPDILHVHWIVPQGIVALAAAPRLPRVVTTHGGDLYALQSAPWRAAKRRVVTHADAITVMNADMAQRVRDLGAPVDRIRVQPMGADADRVRAAGAGVERAPARLMFAGRLVEKKGVAVLFDALATVPPTAGSEPWELDVAGDGPLRAELEARAAELPGRVTFHGTIGQDEVARLWHRATIGVFPSLRAQSGDQDGLPVALLEAMTAGTPVVASDLPGIADAVTDGVSGLLVAPGEPAPLAAAIARLLADPAERDRLGGGALAAAADHSVEAVGRTYVTLLSDVLARCRAQRD